MVAHNTVDSISKDMSSSQSKGLTISKELTQEVLEFIAHHLKMQALQAQQGTN
jgi:hypothetical protein